MGKQIIVAGAGHGGLAAAALLAKRGFEVTVYERLSEGALGYDWTDIFAPDALAAAGLPLPPNEQYCYKENMTFYSSNQKTPIYQQIPRDRLEIKIERRDLCAHLIANAAAAGVRFVYDCEILAPVLTGNRVTGIRTSKGDFFADLIIDAAGLRSPVRSGLPKLCGVENSAGDGGVFYVYRAFYDRADTREARDKYKVLLFPQGKSGVAWIASEENYTDVLIGDFEPFGMDEAQSRLGFLRATNPILGTHLMRGGQFVEIPVRQPLSVMVCEGYAAIGDSAFMTVPIIGSGIANTLKAARILAKTVAADTDGEFSAEKLWSYQTEFYRLLGANLAALACVKRLMMKLTPPETDYLFEKGVLTAAEFSFGSEPIDLSSVVRLPPQEMIKRAKALINDKALLKKLIPALLAIGRLKPLAAAMPKKWNRRRVSLWSERYLGVFKAL